MEWHRSNSDLAYPRQPVCGLAAFRNFGRNHANSVRSGKRDAFALCSSNAIRSLGRPLPCGEASSHSALVATRRGTIPLRTFCLVSGAGHSQHGCVSLRPEKRIVKPIDLPSVLRDIDADFQRCLASFLFRSSLGCRRINGQLKMTRSGRFINANGREISGKTTAIFACPLTIFGQSNIIRDPVFEE